MASYGDMSRSPALASWSQLVALSMTYRRLLAVWAIAPILTASAPLVSKMAYFVLDRFTNNHTILSLLMVCALTLAVRKMIRRSAPSKESAEEAVAKTEVGLPCLMFLASTLVINFIVSPLERVAGIKGILTWSPTISFSSAFRVAAGMLLLGLAVILRFVGPHSVVRCSTSPLLAHPFTIALRKTWRKFSADALLDFLAGPSETPGQLLKSPLEYRVNARRLQNPPFIDAFIQILISALVGAAVAYTSVLPFSPTETHGDSPYKSSLIICCIVATSMNLLQTALDGTSHELNPNRYHKSQWWKRPVLIARTKSVFQSLMTSSLVVPVVAVLAYGIVADSGADDYESVFTLVGTWILTSWIISLYLHLFDEFLRTLLCSPPANMKKIVEEVTEDDKMEMYLDVAMHIVLHSNTALVKDLSSSSKPRLLGLEREERQRNEGAIKVMATTLLEKTIGGAHLEEDMLRLSILASLGGTAWNGQSYGGLDKAGVHHVDNIKEWVQPSDKMKMGGEPLVVPLVRALCAYAGGLGEALINCAEKKTPSTENPWLLPPGAIVCAEYGVRGAARCIVWNFSHSTGPQVDWRSSHLSMLVPVFLNSVYRLESGMTKFTQVRCGAKASDPLQSLELIRTESPELLPLFHACSESAAMVLEKIKSMEGVRRVDFELDPDCQRWTNSILARIPNSSAISTVPSFSSTHLARQ